MKWPCELHEAAAVELRVPTAGKGGQGKGEDDKPFAKPTPSKFFRQAVLDSSGVQDLVDALDEIVGAAGSASIRFRIGVELADGDILDASEAEALATALAKVTSEFKAG